MEPSLASNKPDLARLVRELTRCGWYEAPLDILEGELYFRTFQGGQVAPCLRFGSEKGRHLLLIALEQVALSGEEELFPHFLNLAMETRMALAAARLLGQPDWFLFLTRESVELYRMPEEVCEQRAATEKEMEEELLPALAALAQGREGGISLGARHLPGAESLGGWIQHSTVQLAAALKAPTAAVERMLWKWILMLQVARRSEGSEALGGWGLTCERQEGRWTIAYDAVSATDDLCRALEAFDQSFATRLFAYESAEQTQWLRGIEESSLVDRLRAELLMQSQERFEPETIAWLFTDLAREQEGWRREVAGAEPIRQRFSHDGWTIFRPLVADVGRYGLTAALRDAERLAQVLGDHNLYIQQRRKNDPQGPLSQPDLFHQNPRGIGPGGELDDGLNYLYGEALRVAGVAPERQFGVGVTFLLKALALGAKMEWPFLGLDTLDRLFV